MFKSKTIKMFLLSLLLLFFFFGFSQSIYAKAFDPQVSIPGSDFTRGASSITVNDTTNALALYIKAVYNYAISIVGIVATIMLMFGGFVWLTAGGSGDKVGKARDIIFGSLTGLVLALTSYTLLSMINTDLVNFKVLRIDGVTDTGGMVPCLYDKETKKYSCKNGICDPKTLLCSEDVVISAENDCKSKSFGTILINSGSCQNFCSKDGKEVDTLRSKNIEVSTSISGGKYCCVCSLPDIKTF